MLKLTAVRDSHENVNVADEVERPDHGTVQPVNVPPENVCCTPGSRCQSELCGTEQEKHPVKFWSNYNSEKL